MSGISVIFRTLRSHWRPPDIGRVAALVVLSALGPLAAQVVPAPGWCSMGHCNPQMTDFVPQMPPGLNGNVYVKTNDAWNTGVSAGDGCISNGTYVACVYKQPWNAIVVYNGNGTALWGTAGLIDNHSYSGMPIIEADGTLIAGDDQHLFGFNPDGSIAWMTNSPGGVPIGLVPTPNGAVFAATAGQQLNQCWQANCTLSFIMTNAGSGYTTANVILAGGYCPGASATATITNGSVTGITATTQGLDCDVAPDVIILGDGIGATASATLVAPAPVALYSGAAANTGALVGSTYLYQTGDSGPYYATINTPCVNNGSHPNRLYVLAGLQNDSTQGALIALDIDPTNLASPITPAWNLTFHGPSGASPLCVGDHVYFDGTGIAPGDNVGTTIFGVQDNGASGSFLFQVPLGPTSEDITCNFALDPRPVGGFWHQIRYDPNIYHRDFNTGQLLDTINVSNLLVAAGAPPSTYWQAGIFTTYGTASQPYLMLPEAPRPGNLGYLAMLDIGAQKLVWAAPLAGNDNAGYDTPGGDAALVLDSNQNPVMVMSGKQTAAYFIANGGPDASFSSSSLSFGPQVTGTTSPAQSVTFTNSAAAVLNISSITVSGPFSQTNTCGATLASGVGCTISVTFKPAAAGALTGILTVTSSSFISPQTLALAGTGTSATAAVTLTPKLLGFPPQPLGTVSVAKKVTLTNTGTAALVITSIVPSGATAQTNNCPTTLAANASCTLNVMLAAPPSGACAGKVTVNTNAPGAAAYVTAAGSCTSVPTVESAVSTSSLVFNPQTVGTLSATQTITLTSIGSSSLTIHSITPVGDVSQTNNCGGSLNPAASCVITVTFGPTATGARTGTVAVFDAAPDSPHVVSISGVGLPNPVPVVNQPLLPSAVQPGAPGLSLAVMGSGFVPGSVVYWNGTPRLTTFTGSTQLTASITSADLASPATGSVSVVNPTPGGGQSNIVWLPVGYASPAPTFSTSTLPASAGPAAVATADLNADGKLDLAVANVGAATVSVLLGNGDGTFAPKMDYSAGNQPRAVAIADLNHDGLPDLVIANQADNTVSVLLGTGSGTFGAQHAYPTGLAPVAIAIADLNADGNLDLAVANQADDTVSILMGNGDGTFVPHIDYPSGLSPMALIAADFNGDGKPDLAVANGITPGGTVTVLLNHGDGSYLPGTPYATGNSVSLAAADFNGDGILDWAAVNNQEQTLSVYLGNGDGTFRLGPNQATHMTPYPAGLVAADINADGMLDLVTANDSALGVMVLYNNDAGNFSQILQYAGVTGVASMAAGDFNNDGSIDLAAVPGPFGGIGVVMQVPAVALSSGTANFGNIAVGGSASQTIVVTNSGSAVLRISSVSAGGGADFSQTNNCVSGGPIAPGNSCSINLTFHPTTTGVKTSVLTIRDNAAGGSQIATMGGIGAVFTVAVGLQQNPVIGGAALSSNTITVSRPAPAGGWTVNLSSSNPAVAAVPASVTVAAGQTVSPGFTITTSMVSARTPVTITATLNAYSATAVLTVTPIGVAFTLSATGTPGGLTLASNTLTLSAPAPTGGYTFNLSSSNPALGSVPASVSVAAGATVSSPFSITTSGVATTTTVAIFASLNGVSGSIANVSLNIWPAVPSSLSLSQSTVVAGLSTTNNVVNLTGLAPASGLTITLSSSKPTVAAVPASVTVPANAGASSPFTITTGFVSASTPVTITAALGTTSVMSTLTVTPDGAASVNLSPSTVVGGTISTATNSVTLLAPAPQAGALVMLTSSNPSVASVPPSVNVAPGSSTSANFKITTTVVATSTQVTITGTYNGIAATATLTVQPLAPVSVNLTQLGVTGGKPVMGNTVTLNAPAPAGGITLSLSSSNPAIASVPPTVTVAGGSNTSAPFNITTTVPTKATSIAISASYQGNKATGYLTVKP